MLGKRGYEVAQAVADGRAEIGTTFISEALHGEGRARWSARCRASCTMPTPIPPPFHAAAAAPEARRALLLRKLTDPATAARWTAAGLEPAFAGR